ncbi:carbohydrate-binding domain-containing protein [Beduinella massiliensis]|uniref:carbohydrate-binding domain-containing protein n=1 Tax=Beduinella massiliensis TaxID=1852363 RepID=UPI000C845441
MKAIVAAYVVLCLLINTPSALGEQAAGPVDVNAIEWKAKDEYTEYGAEAIHIALADGATEAGEGYGVEGDVVTITREGTYVLTGSLSDGQIVVCADKDEDVRLVLENVAVTSTSAAPLYVIQADKVIVSLPEGTQSTLTDKQTAQDEEGREITATIFARSDLTINGSGSLVIRAGARDGIATKDTLKLTGGTLDIEASDDGIVAKDRALIRGGDISIVSAGDGVKVTGTEADQGYFYMEGGALHITAAGDGIQAASSVLIAGGEIEMTTGGGSASAEQKVEAFGGRGWGVGAQQQTQEESISTKGIKAEVYVDMTGGTVAIDSCDDSIHSNDTVRISGGVIQASSGDDGVHADAVLEISGGKVTIAESYEGLEAASVEITGGEIEVRASDDGINAAGGSDGSQQSGPFGRDSFASQEGVSLVISGGLLYVDASGDGLDSNGDLTITGGQVYVSGPTGSGDGTFDSNGTFSIDGGLVLGIGSTGMMETPAQTSKQNTLVVTGTDYAAGSVVEVRDAEGSALASWIAPKQFASVIFSSPEIERNATYEVYVDGELMEEIDATEVTSGAGSDLGNGRGGRGGGRGDWEENRSPRSGL